MSADGRLPEDIAAEQAYLAELRGERAAAQRRLAESADSSVSSVRDPLAPAPAPAAAGGIAAETLLQLSPELLEQLPPAARQAVEAARRERAQRELGLAPPVPLPAAAGTPRSTEQTWLDGADTGVDPVQSEAELARREAAILAQIQAELADSGVRRKGRFDTAPIRVLDHLLGLLFGRRNTW